jgi:hypothetical protein
MAESFAPHPVAGVPLNKGIVWMGRGEPLPLNERLENDVFGLTRFHRLNGEDAAFLRSVSEKINGQNRRKHG